MDTHRSLALLLALLAAPGPFPRQDPPPAADAAEKQAPDFETRLRKNPFFKKIAWTTDASFAPYEILVQKQAVPEPDYERNVAQFYGPWLKRMAALFEESVAAPAQLPAVEKPEPIRVIVLLSEGDFLNYSKTVHTYDGFGRSSFYDDRFRAVVTYWDVPGPAHLKRYPVLRRFVYALLHQRSTAFLGRQSPLWIREGLSGALAWHVGSDPATAFAKPLVEPSLLEGVVKLAQDVPRQNLFLRPLRKLAGIVARDELWRRYLDEATAAGLEVKETDPWYDGYLQQSILWVHFLRREGAAAHNRAFEEYLRACMRGGGSPTELAKAFQGQDLSALDREFFRWVYARAKEAGKGAKDEKALATLFLQSAGTEGTLTGQALAERLAPALDEPTTIRALALRRASQGDVEGAIQALEQRAAASAVETEVAALRADLERLNAWKSARDAWLAELVAGGGRLQLERDGKKVSLKATRLEKGVLQLESAKTKEEVPVTSLAPALIAGQMKANPAGAPEWTRAFAMLLCGDERWEKLLKDKSPAAQALRADAEGSYPDLSKHALAVDHLLALSKLTAPADAAAGTAILERLRRVRQEVATQGVVLDRQSSLLALARIAAGKVYDGTHPTPEFGGRATWIDVTTLELEYSFESASELEDWLSRPEDLADWREIMPKAVAPAAEWSSEVAGGVWSMRGEFLFRHALPFDAPMQVKAVMRHGSAADETTQLGVLVLGVCERGTDGLAATTAGGIYVYDSKTGLKVHKEPAKYPDMYVGKDFVLELAHDGQKLRFVLQDTAVPEEPVGTLRSGGIFLMASGDRDLAIDSLFIRGKVGPEAQKRLRERWIAQAVS